MQPVDRPRTVLPRARTARAAEATATLRRRALLLLALLPLAACGRNGPPEPPPGADPAFPRRYPTR